MNGQRGMGFVDEYRRASQLVQFAQSGRIVGCERLEKLDSGNNHDRSVPPESIVPGLNALEVGTVVMSGHDLIPCLAFECQCIPINTDRLVDDVGEWKHDEDAAQSLVIRSPEQMRHDCGGLASSNRTVTREHGGRGCGVSGSLINLHTKSGSRVRFLLRQTFHVPVQTPQPLRRLERQSSLRDRLALMLGGVRMVGVHQA